MNSWGAITKQKKEQSKGCYNTDFDHYWEHDAHLDAAYSQVRVKCVPTYILGSSLVGRYPKHSSCC